MSIQSPILRAAAKSHQHSALENNNVPKYSLDDAVITPQAATEQLPADEIPLPEADPEQPDEGEDTTSVPPATIDYPSTDPGVINFMEATPEQVIAALHRTERFAKWLRAVYEPAWLYHCWRRHPDVVFTLYGLERAYLAMHQGDDLTSPGRWWYYLDAAEARIRNTKMARGCENGKHEGRTRIAAAQTTKDIENQWFLLAPELAATFTWPALDETNTPTGPTPHPEFGGLPVPDHHEQKKPGES